MPGSERFARVGSEADDPEEKIAAIVEDTTTPRPGHTHWSARTMATRVGVAGPTVQRIWAARGLAPHRVDSFKLSNDPLFEEKLIDVVGLYLAPPDNAIVLCMDEKSQVQALDRPAVTADGAGPGRDDDP